MIIALHFFLFCFCYQWNELKVWNMVTLESLKCIKCMMLMCDLNVITFHCAVQISSNHHDKHSLPFILISFSSWTEWRKKNTIWTTFSALNWRTITNRPDHVSDVRLNESKAEQKKKHTKNKNNLIYTCVQCLCHDLLYQMQISFHYKLFSDWIVSHSHSKNHYRS